MELFHTQIGEHAIQLICQSEALMCIMRKNFPAADLIVSKPDIIIYLKEGYGVSFVDYDVEITKEVDSVSFRRADYLIEAELDYRYAVISVNNELALKHALMNMYSSYVVHHKWGLLIHSSCVMDKGKAYLFAGHSGAGKSTAAKLSMPRNLLSDEATVVKIMPDKVTIFNSPFRSELDRTTGAEENSPLAGIYLLNQAVDNHIVPLSKSNGFLHLMDKVFYWSHSPEEIGGILQLLQQLVNSVSICELHFQKNDTFWELIS